MQPRSLDFAPEHPLFRSRPIEHPAEVPFALVADAEGNIEEHPQLRCMGRTGNDLVALRPEDFIPLPEGSEFFALPGRKPLGWNPETQQSELMDGDAVAAFVSPAHTQTYLAAYEKQGPAPILPLYAYTALGWFDGRFWTTAVRVDPDLRQDVSQFHAPMIEGAVDRMKKRFPDNRLVEHLSTQCAGSYQCRAAQNFFLERWELPIPSSPACNATCLGCISLQEDEDVSSAHFRLKFIPDSQEIADIALHHLEHAPYPVMSFGQGCEGEPLLVADTLAEAMRRVRAVTDRGIFNINTNGSRPDDVAKLCEAGLRSIRVSMNSAQKDWYTGYYLPRNYEFEALAQSLKVVRQHGGWASINYFVFPGCTDTPAEWDALQRLIENTDLSMIQWRNFNIDPDWYFKKLRKQPDGNPFGVLELMHRVRETYPHIAYGYFNPAAETQAYYNAKRS
jgi:hypothetical protein